MHPVAERLQLALIPRVGYWYIRLLRLTMRLSYRNREVLDRVRAESGQYILVFWHSRFVMMPYCYPGDRLVVLSSGHRDSQLLARILVRFGLTIAEGSSTAGGARGLRNLLRRVKEGHDIGVTPDGPRGPRREMKAGVIATARLSGLPLIPVAFSASRGRRLASWDRTLVPWPFSRGLFIYGEPMCVPRDAADDDQERARVALQDEVNRLTDLADREIGFPLEDAR